MVTRTRLNFDASLGHMYGIWCLDFLLRIPTLGVYSFWGKTRMRKYVTASTVLDGERFAYHGTGGELLRGFLKAMPFLIAVYLPFVLLASWNELFGNLVFVPLLYLMYVGSYSAHRYRMSRTSWRGIRGHLGGSAFGYANRSMGYLLMEIFTLFFCAHIADLRRRRIVIGNSYYGGCKAEFHYNPEPLMLVNALTVLLAIPTLGMSRFWYRAALNRYIFACTGVGGLTFSNDQTGGQLCGLVAGNFLITLVTFGCGAPWVQRRRQQFLVSHLTIHGDLDTSGIFQSDVALGRSGEGLDALIGDMDAGFFTA